jgi:hypothetical protein
MKEYTKPRIDVLLFDEEEVLANASNVTATGYTAARAVTQMFGDDDKAAATSGRSTTTVSITKIGLVGD